MAEDFLNLFVGGKPKQGPPAPHESLSGLDRTFKSLGVKGGLKEVQTRNRAEKKANERSLGSEWKKIESRPGLSEEDRSLARSFVFMSMRDADGNEIDPVQGEADVSKFKPTVTYADALKMLKDPAVRKRTAEQRQTWRDYRERARAVKEGNPGGYEGYEVQHPSPDTPSLRPLTKAEHEKSVAEQEAARVPLGPVGTFQKQAEDAAGALFRHLPVPGGENIAKGVVGAALSPFSSGEMMNDARVPDYDRNMAAAQFFAGLLAATGGGSFVSNFTKSGGSLAKGVMGSVGALKEAVPELAGKIDEAASVLSKLPEQEADDLLRSVTTEDPVTAQAEAPVTGPKEPWQVTMREYAPPGANAWQGWYEHRRSVETALSEGKPVPPEVLADYPDLAAKYATSVPEAPTSAKAVSEPSTIASEARTQEAPPTTLEAPQESVAIPEGQSLSTPPQSTRRTVMDVQAEIDAVRARRDARVSKERKLTKRSGAVTIGPDDLKDALTLGRLHFEKGLRSFDDWAREMVKAFGTGIRAHLPDIWKQVDRPVEGEPVAKLQAALKDARPLRSDVAARLSEEARSERAGRLAGAQAKSVGKPMGEALGRQLGSQKGSYANYSFELPEAISPEDLAHMKDMVLTHPRLRPYEKLNAQLALEKIAGDGQYGGLPTDSELSALERVFGKEFGTKLRLMAGSPDLWDEVMLHRKAGLLSGVRTLVRNAGGNALQATRREVLRPLDAGADWLVSVAAGTRGNGRTIAGWVSPSAERTRTVAQKTAQDVAEIMKHGQSWEGSAEVVKESRNPLVRYALRFQGVQDAVWMNAAYERSLAEQASLMVKQDPKLDFRTLMDDPTEAMEAQALLDSQIATFNAPNKMYDAMKAFAQVPVLGRVFDFLVPFKRVPANIGSELAQYSVAGPVYNLGKAVSEIRETGKMTVATQKALSKSVVNGTLGTALTAYGWELARRGLLTGASPTDPTDKTTKEALGERPASLQIGGSRFQLTGTHPLLSMIAIGATMQEASARRYAAAQSQSEKLTAKGLDPGEFGLKAGADPTSGVKDAAVAFGQIMQEQPFLKGIKDFTDSAQSERKLEQFVNSAAASFAPVFMNDALRTVGKGDDVVRDPSNPAEAWRARLGFGKDLPPKYDAFGREVKLGGVFDVTNAKEVKTDPVSLAMKKHGLKVTKLERQPQESAAHYEQRQKLYGRFLYSVMSELAPAIDKLDKKSAQTLWKRTVDKVRTKLGGALDTSVLKALPTD